MSGGSSLTVASSPVDRSREPIGDDGDEFGYGLDAILVGLEQARERARQPSGLMTGPPNGITLGHAGA